MKIPLEEIKNPSQTRCPSYLDSEEPTDLELLREEIQAALESTLVARPAVITKVYDDKAAVDVQIIGLRQGPLGESVGFPELEEIPMSGIFDGQNGSIRGQHEPGDTGLVVFCDRETLSFRDSEHCQPKMWTLHNIAHGVFIPGVLTFKDEYEKPQGISISSKSKLLLSGNDGSQDVSIIQEYVNELETISSILDTLKTYVGAVQTDVSSALSAVGVSPAPSTSTKITSETAIDQAKQEIDQIKTKLEGIKA